MYKGSQQIDTGTIRSFDSTLKVLRVLDVQLPSSMPQFSLFNSAYTLITKSIQEHAKNGYFENPKFIEAFTVCFAKFYIQAINDTLSHNPELPTAWKILNDVSNSKKVPNFTFLLMGANAHINHDLPLALFEQIGDVNPRSLLHDVRKVDKILMKSGRQIISLFDEQNRLVNFIKSHFVVLYYRPIMYAVLYWRTKAWRNYKKIQMGDTTNSSYANYSIKIAKRFAWLAHFFK